MRIAIIQVFQETNTFSPRPTTLADFQCRYMHAGNELIEHLTGTRTEIGGFLDVLPSRHVTAVPILAAWAMPCGRVTAETLGHFCDRIGDGLKAAGTLDGVLVSLHGAMAADACDDGDGALLQAVRSTVGGDTPVVCALDWHANLTDCMLDAADAVVGYRTYPHRDAYETGQRAARLLLQQLESGRRPQRDVIRLPLIAHPMRSQSDVEPMRSIVAALDQLEAACAGASVSLFLTQPWLDVADFASTLVLYTDGCNGPAAARQRDIAERLWSVREQFLDEWPSAPAAIIEALARPDAPVLVCDLGDVVLAGAPGTEATLIEAMLAHQPRPRGVAPLCAPHLVKALRTRQPGDTVSLSLAPGEPTVEARVVAVTNAPYTVTGPYLTGIEFSPGTRVVVAVDNVTIVLTENPESAQDPAFYDSVGIDLRAQDIVVVKSHNTYKPAYAEISTSYVNADTPGASAANVELLDFRSVPRPLFPLDREFS